jgi:hypothetical protein
VGTASGSPGRRGPPAVAWVLVLAVLVGVAAALLSRPVGPLGPSPPAYGPLSWNHWGELLAILALVGVGAWLFVLLRDSTRRVPIPGRVVATILVVLLIGVLFVELAGFVHYGPLPSTGNSTGAGGGAPGTSNGTGNSNATLFGTPSVPLPAWVGIAAVLGIALVAAVLLVPYAVRRMEFRRRTQEEPAAPAEEAQRALREALDRLRSTDGSDARATILALYSRLLQLVGPRLGDLESRTPREIEGDSIAALGVRPGVARDLRETFEEARYSSHPLTADAVGRAQRALADAISDLAPGAGPGP